MFINRKFIVLTLQLLSGNKMVHVRLIASFYQSVRASRSIEPFTCKTIMHPQQIHCFEPPTAFSNKWFTCDYSPLLTICTVLQEVLNHLHARQLCISVANPLFWTSNCFLSKQNGSCMRLLPLLTICTCFKKYWTIYMQDNCASAANSWFWTSNYFRAINYSGAIIASFTIFTCFKKYWTIYMQDNCASAANSLFWTSNYFRAINGSRAIIASFNNLYMLQEVLNHLHARQLCICSKFIVLNLQLLSGKKWVTCDCSLLLQSVSASRSTVPFTCKTIVHM